jgi:hypothetical protein
MPAPRALPLRSFRKLTDRRLRYLWVLTRATELGSMGLSTS